GTLQNDAMESRVIHALFGAGVPVSSTKPFTGHALGAAGAIEAGLCWLAMQDDNPEGKLPPHLWDGTPDPGLPVLSVAERGSSLGQPLRWILSNSFAFGGANATLVLGREGHGHARHPIAASACRTDGAARACHLGGGRYFTR